MAKKHAREEALQELRKNVLEILGDKQSLPLHKFFEVYYQKFHKIDAQLLGVAKASLALTLIPDTCELGKKKGIPSVILTRGAKSKSKSSGPSPSTSTERNSGTPTPSSGSRQKRAASSEGDCRAKEAKSNSGAKSKSKSSRPSPSPSAERNSGTPIPNSGSHQKRAASSEGVRTPKEAKSDMSQNFYDRFYGSSPGSSGSSNQSWDGSRDRRGSGPNYPRGYQPMDMDFPELSHAQQAMPQQRSHRVLSTGPPRGGGGGGGGGGMAVQFMGPPMHTPPQHIPQRHPPRNFVSKEQLGRVAEDAIDRLAESGEYVSLEHIETLILQHFEATNLRDLGVHRVENIQIVNQHMRHQCKLNAYIQAFVRVRSIATIHELKQNLGDYLVPGKQYDELKMGPLQKQPLIYEFFKFPENSEIPQLTTGDLLEHLRGYLTENDAWTKRVEVEEFLTYLTQKCNVDSPYDLGVRLRSVPLATSVLKKAQRECGQSVRTSVTELKEGVMRDLATAFRQFASSIIEKDGTVCRVRQHYFRMDATSVFEEVSTKLKLLIDSLFFLQQTTQLNITSQKTFNRGRDAVDKFTTAMRGEPLLRQLFQAAVCLSREEMHHSLEEIFMKNQEKNEGEPGVEKAKTKDPPQPYELIGSAVRYMERCVAHGALSLSHLARIENKILEDQDFPSFVMMGQGTFLDFVLKTEKLRKMLEDSGGGLLGNAGGGGTSESVFHASFQDLLEFIQQTGVTDNAQSELIEAALCQHYGVADVKALGHGALSNLLKASARQQTNHDTSVFYESALCAKNKFSWFGNSQKVGIIGHQSKEKALCCLQQCPLLEDLAEWSHWDLVFRPELGDLREFVQKYGGVYSMPVTDSEGRAILTTHILALETRPGVLLKATSDTNPEKLANAAMAGDVMGLCGHLVSLVIANKGTENTPLVLLGNHVKTALLHMQASMGDETTGEEQCVAVVKFVLECLCRLPFIICQSTANQVFLEPLSHVVGASRSKELLLRECCNASQQSRLQLLGCLLGVREWAHTFDARLAQPAECLTRPSAPTVEEEVIMIGDGESSEDEDSSSDDDDEKNDNDSLSLSSDDEDEVAEVPVEQGAKAKEEDARPKADVVSIDSSSEECVTIEETTEATKDNISVVAMDTSESEEVEISSTIDEVDPCKLLIETIRRDEFGVGVELSEDGRKLMAKQQERLGRSLNRLSKDLYSKDTHFVLELIQNADDNDYSASTKIPAVKFLVDSTRIIVMNNECGFEEKNIRAICDVGKSTKGKHKFGYIGQKGIGFKSVFRVTDTPHIHSGGFHLHFDVNSLPMGYILPHWVDEAPPENPDNWVTQIVLPLKSELQTQSQAQSLAARFQDVHPSLLLFLHRLKSISVVNQVQGYTLIMERRDLARDVIEIQHKTGTDRWLVIRKTLDASHISLQAKSGVEVESTEIALAFPLPSKDVKNIQVLPTKQPVFAFLPLRSYGFRFIVQGDFDVPSSREDVDKDSLWNQWLRNEIPGLFVEALKTFKSQPDMEGLRAVCLWSQFIPLEDEVLDFFQPVASNILRKLRAEACMPTQPVAGQGIHWKLPSQVVAPTDALLQEVVSPLRLQRCLSLFYLHKDVATAINPALVAGLGIQTLTTNHLMEICKHILHELESQEVIELQIVVQLIAKWLACMYRSMDEFQHDDELLKRLRGLPMIPLTCGSFVALQDNTIFFPLDAEERHKREANTSDPLWALERDLNTIHPGLFHSENQVVTSQALRLLEQLGVKKLTASDVIQHHIMPVLQSEEWKSKSQDLLVAYVVYLKDQLERHPSLVNLDQLRSVIALVTNKGVLRVSEQSIHFPPAYGNGIDLQEDLPGLSWTLVHTVYIQNIHSHIDLQKWHTFFQRLGVLDLMAVNATTVEIKASNLSASPWSGLKDVLPDPEASYQIADFSSPQLEALVLENVRRDVMLPQMKALYEMMDRHWDTHYHKFKYALLKDMAGNTLREIDSSFVLNLQQLSWLPGQVIEASCDGSGRAVQAQTIQLLPGKQLWLHSPAVDQLLAHHVSYLDMSPHPSSSFTAFVGVRSNVTKEFLVECLEKWSRREEEEQPAELVTSLTHMKVVYQYLQAQLPPVEFQGLFRRLPCIYVPMGPCENTVQVMGGKMLRPSEVRWSDPHGLFHKYSSSLRSFHVECGNKPAIQPLYHDLQDWFLKSARVPPKPSLGDYGELLVHVADTRTMALGLLDVLAILSMLGGELLDAWQKSKVDGEHMKEQLKQFSQQIQHKLCIPATNGDWVSLAQKPYIADNRFLEEMFSAKPGVVFVDQGLKALTKELGRGRLGRGRGQTMAGRHGINQESLLAVLEVLGVGMLSNHVSVEEITESYQPCPPLQHYARFALPAIQRLLCSDHEELYSKLMDKYKMDTRVPAMQFGQVGKLEVVYSLTDKQQIVVTKPENCKLTEKLEFYVDRLCVESQIKVNQFEVIKELARFFSMGDQRCMKDVRNLLLNIAPYVDKDLSELDDFMRRDGTSELPESETRWEIPEPMLYLQRAEEPDVEMIEEVESSSAIMASQGSSGQPSAAWPPKSSAVGGGVFPPTGPKRDPKASWPPPAPPSSVQRHHLPENLRPPRADLVVVAQDGSKTDAAAPKAEGGSETPGQGGHTHGQRVGGSGSGPHPGGSGSGPHPGAPHSGGAPHPGGSHGTNGHATSGGAHPGTPHPGGSGPHPGHPHHSAPYPGGPPQQAPIVVDVDAVEAETAELSVRDTSPQPGTEGAAETMGPPGRPALRAKGSLKRPRMESGGSISEAESSQGFFNQFDMPIWAQEVPETPYEEIGSGTDLRLPENAEPLVDDELGTTIGRWGEQLVYYHLIRLSEQPQSNIANVQWVNEEKETGLPYDLIITEHDEETQVANSIFIEVKSTISDKKMFFDMSVQEVKFAQEQQANYHLYRVFCAGNATDVRLTKLQNLGMLMEKRLVRLCLAV